MMRPPLLIFLPGTLCDAQVWSAQSGALSHRHPVAHIVYPSAAQSIDAMAQAALAQIDATGEQRFIPIGSSMGAMVAMALWLRAPQRIAAMALCNCNLAADTLPRRAAREAMLLRALHGHLGQVAMELAEAYRGDSALSAAILSDAVGAMARRIGVDAYASQLAALATRIDYLPVLAGIHVPVLLIGGESDRLCPQEMLQEMHRRLPRARLEVVHGAGHLPSVERPAIVTSLLRRWIATT